MPSKRLNLILWTLLVMNFAGADASDRNSNAALELPKKTSKKKGAEPNFPDPSWLEHWAYQPLKKVTLPELTNSPYHDYSQNPIDLFIAKGWLKRGVQPQESASPKALIRRLFYDMIGLPPEYEEVESFRLDPTQLNYEQLVDRLLTSPHFGERQARHWMDLVHFAETHGHDQDRIRENAWPYRDYLIRAFNEDRPYSRFIEDQIAGDLLYPDDPWSIAATGMLAAGPWDESSLRDIRPDSIDRLKGHYLDRDDIVTNVFSTFMSTTVHCARCHDHKFDPVSQREYYGLQAIFSGVDKANRKWDSDPGVTRRRHELQAKFDQLKKPTAEVGARYLEGDAWNAFLNWRRAYLERENRWIQLKAKEARSTSGSPLVLQSDGSYLAQGKAADKDTYIFQFDQQQAEPLTAVLLEVLPDSRLPQKGPGRQDNGNLHLSTFKVRTQTENKNWNDVEIVHAFSDFDQEGWTIQHAIDTNPASAWGIYPQVGKAHWAVFVFKNPVELNSNSKLEVQLHQLHGGRHLIGKLRLAVTTMSQPRFLEPTPQAIDQLITKKVESLTQDERIQLALWWNLKQTEKLIQSLPKPQAVYSGTPEFQADGTFTPAGKPRTVKFLDRGEVERAKEEIGPHTLSFLKGLSGDLKLNKAATDRDRRTQFARWLTQTENALVYRSIVNRIWQQYFGRGLVHTASDFGLMGGRPSHPELLDWLALYFIEQRGSLKQLHRLIVTSRVYQLARSQVSSTKDDCFSAYPARRMSAESFRDSLLVLSRELLPIMGGPSDRQFNASPGVHVTPNLDYQGFSVKSKANFRRSVYRFIFRTVPDPFMSSLDCPDASQLTPKREESISALQALATLNDKLVIELCQRLAANVQKSEVQLDRQIVTLYKRILLREPTSKEVELTTAYAKKYGLNNLSRFLFNTNEFMFIE